MPRWEPKPIWAGRDCFIVGGGPSLRGFDFSLLRAERAIGCNNAFRLGPDICDYCVFVDRKFIIGPDGKPRSGFYDGLAEFGNPVITSEPRLRDRPERWLYWYPRKARGLHRDARGYNYNCGATAINAALLLGATTVYLLGFDMHLGDRGEPNWHSHLIDRPSPNVYFRMLAAFAHVKRDLVEKFPGCRVVNVNDDSALKCFPTVGTAQFWAERARAGKEAAACGS